MLAFLKEAVEEQDTEKKSERARRQKGDTRSDRVYRVIAINTLHVSKPYIIYIYFENVATFGLSINVCNLFVHTCQGAGLSYVFECNIHVGIFARESVYREAYCVAVEMYCYTTSSD